MKISMWLTVAASILVSIAVLIALALVVPILLMFGWNASMPAIFGLPEVSFVQALGFCVVVAILSGAIRGSDKE